MSTLSDFEITPTLSAKRCLHGSDFDGEGGIVELYGITGHEFNYTGMLSLEQTKSLIAVLSAAVRERENTLAWEAKGKP